jgi:hypothetical protein
MYEIDNFLDYLWSSFTIDDIKIQVTGIFFKTKCCEFELNLFVMLLKGNINQKNT